MSIGAGGTGTANNPTPIRICWKRFAGRGGNGRTIRPHFIRLIGALMHCLKVEFDIAYGEPIEARYLELVGFRLEAPTGWVILIPAGRSDLAEELSPGCTQ